MLLSNYILMFLREKTPLYAHLFAYLQSMSQTKPIIVYGISSYSFRSKNSVYKVKLWQLFELARVSKFKKNIVSVELCKEIWYLKGKRA